MLRKPFPTAAARPSPSRLTPGVQRLGPFRARPVIAWPFLIGTFLTGTLLTTGPARGQAPPASTYGTTPIQRPVIDGGLVSVDSAEVDLSGAGRLIVRINDRIVHVAGMTFSILIRNRRPDSPAAVDFNEDAAQGGAVLPGALVLVRRVSDIEVRVGMIASRSGSGPGVVVALPFQVKGNGRDGAVFDVQLSDPVISVNFVDLTSATGAGTITVYGRLRGDVAGDGDGRITVDDAVAALQLAEGIGTPDDPTRFAADIDGDGEITLRDAAAILYVAMGLGAFPPPPTP